MQLKDVMHPLKISLTSILLFVMSTAAFAQKSYQLFSPDNTIRVTLNVNDGVNYSVSVDGKSVIQPSRLSLETSEDMLQNWKVTKAERSNHDGTLHPIIWQKSKTISNHYNALTILFSNGQMLEWRAFDEGIAWRWKSQQTGSYKIFGEDADFNFVPGGKAWYPEEDKFYSHNERLYKRDILDSLTNDSLASLPVLTQVKGVKMLITESSLFDYSGLWVRGNAKGGLKGVHPHYPKQTKVTSDRDEKVISRENFIAKVTGPQSFPWRVIMVARHDKDLLDNQLVYTLAKQSSGDYSWVEPGKVAWDWWNARNIYNVDFRAGINTRTYKYYIDFASKYGIKYILLDEGWSDTRDLLKVNPDLDMAALTAYAKSKGVGILLWMSWLTLDHQMDAALDQFDKWGIKGIKIDFMQRDDQPMVNFYQHTAEKAAKHHLLVDFHGAFKPTGWLRTYPNVLSSEGVLGNEWNKGSNKDTPTHNITIPFIRMAAGPMDFTPGGMRNAHKDTWAAIGREPMTMGTRANQLAMYVIYESPLQMLCDTPTHYYDAPKAMDFLSKVPVQWMQTLPLQAQVGHYAVVARQAPNGDWFVGAMTGESPCQLSVSLSFLEADQPYTMHVWQDGINADRNAKDLAIEEMKVHADMKVPIKMVRGGGWVARISKIKK